MLTTLILTIILIIGNSATIQSAKKEKGYDYIEQTENQEVIQYTEEIGRQYGICPELLQAIVFYESSNRETVKNTAGDTGYMAVNPKWHSDRMDKLGVTDLKDGYSNILVGTDYLAELAQKYQDLPLVLMKYNGDSRAERLAEAGEMSDYARKIIDLAEKLERIHGK